MNQQKLKLYGAEWCMKTSMIRNYLQSKWIDFEYFDVESNKEAANELRALYNGKLKFPTVTDGTIVLKNPTISDLNEKLHLR